MIFDSEAQKQRVIDLIGEVPVATNIKGIVSGPSPEIMDLMSRLVSAHVISADEQTILLLKKEEIGAHLSDR